MDDAAAALDRRRYRLGIVDVAIGPFDRQVGDALGVGCAPQEHPHGPAFRHQGADDMAAEESAGAGDKDLSLKSIVGHCLSGALSDTNSGCAAPINLFRQPVRFRPLPRVLI